MRAKIYLTLSEAEQLALEDMVRNSSSHRIRQRSQALLWSHAGKDRNTIAELYGTKPDTISAWFKRWESEKLSGLSDLPRSGRPAKLNEEQKKRC
jgi:transposase